MDRTLLFATAAAAVALASCDRKVIDTPVTSLTVTASAEGTSKASFSDEGIFSWTDGDAFALVTGEGTVPFTLTSGAGTDVATFTGNLSQGTAATVAVVPATAAVDATTVTLPSSYTYVEGQTNAILVADASDLTDRLAFRHVGGLVKIVFTSLPDDADALVLTAGARITGNFALGNGQIVAEEAASDAVTVQFPAGSRPAAFYVPVPTGTYTLSVELRRGGEAIPASVKTASEALTIDRRTLLLMEAVPFIRGEGTAEKPYEITCAAEWNLAAESMNSEGTYAADAVYAIGADIDFTGTSFTPIKNFKGTLEGNEHTLSGIVSTSGAATFGGLVHTNDGTLRNLTVQATLTATHKTVGGIVGRNNGVLDGVAFNGTITGTGAFATCGGIAGVNYGVVVNSAMTGGSIIGKEATKSENLGGVVGQNNTGGWVLNCYSWTASISSSNNNHGGLVGIMSSDSKLAVGYSTITVFDCSNNYSSGVGYSKAGNIRNIFGNTACNTNKAGQVVANDKKAGTLWKTTTGALLSLENMVSGAVTLPSSGESYDSFVAALNAAVAEYEALDIAGKPSVTLRTWTAGTSYPVLQ